MAKVSAGWMDTFASLPADKVAADAVIGGVGGMGLNYAANSSTGDSGGYLGSAVGGAALGGAARGTLKKLGANRSERMAIEAAEAAAARAERDAIRSANRTDLKTGVIDKSVSVFGKIADNIVGRSANMQAAVQNSPGLAATRNIGQSTRDIFSGGSNYSPTRSSSFVSNNTNTTTNPGGPFNFTGQTGMAGATPPPIDNSFRAQMMRSAGTLNEYQNNISTSSALNDLASAYN